jgi:hypothetical protein
MATGFLIAKTTHVLIFLHSPNHDALFQRFYLFVLFSFVSPSENAKIVRGAQRQLEADSDNANVSLGVAGNYAILAKTGITTVQPSDGNDHRTISCKFCGLGVSE